MQRLAWMLTVADAARLTTLEPVHRNLSVESVYAAGQMVVTSIPLR
jgi:hypothetical protein